MAIILISIKGYSGEGQGNILSSTLNAYIEETSASIAEIYSESRLATISSMIDPSIGILGQGGQQTLNTEPETIAGSAFLAYNPVDEDYINSVSNKRTGIIEYTVQPGDALSFIASDYGVSTSSIIWANNLKSADSIYPGQNLRIPPVSGVIHKVLKGETIASIANKYSISESEIADFNNKNTESTIKIGEELIIPGGTVTAAKTKVATVQQRFSHLPDLGSFFMAPTDGYNWGIIHGRNGIDIANSCGTPIYAAAGGTVTATSNVGWNGGFGKYIRISHDNETETLYAHLSKVIATEGSNISKGELIGLMGTTGRSTGCHLHFEVHGAKNPLSD